MAEKNKTVYAAKKVGANGTIHSQQISSKNIPQVRKEGYKIFNSHADLDAWTRKK